MPRRKLTLEEFIDRSNKSHNFKYSYSKSVYIDAFTKIIIICPIHGDFEQLPIGHWRGKGCEKCAYELKNKKMSKMKIEKAANEFENKAILIHGNTYNYSKSEYQGSDKNIIIICSIHGEFLQTPSCHLNGSGCSQCSYEKKSEIYTHSQQYVIDQFNVTHGFKYDYSKVIYTGSQNKIEIICPQHGSFFQRASHHMEGRGCPICGKCYISKSESKWLDFIGITQEYRQFSIKIGNKQYFVDGFDPKTNTIYEYYGDYWHGNPNNPEFPPDKINKVKDKTFNELYVETIDRENILKNFGYNIISIWEIDWKNQETNKPQLA
jgi:hypothetical protein